MRIAGFRMDSLRTRIIPSAATHLFILGFLVETGHVWIAPMQYPGDIRGSRVSLTYLPGRIRASAMQTAKLPVKQPSVVDEPFSKPAPKPLKAEAKSEANSLRRQSQMVNPATMRWV